ncbi:MAG: molybdopterin molybdotransferase MoeA [Cyclobacteriaceae bacterium]
MISVQEALKIVRAHAVDFGSETIHFMDATGRVLDEDIRADRDFPPFNRATMDGICLSLKDWQSGISAFPISGEQFAGAPQQSLQQGTCMEIMTGAVVPHGADVVIRYEDLNIKNGAATVNLDAVTELMNVHLKGHDAEENSVLIKSGKRISQGDIGILTSVGKTSVQVKKQPRIAIISAGDELVEPDQGPLPHQIRKSNVYTLCSLLKSRGLSYELFHINDEMEEINTELGGILERFDLILLSGGVSKGKKDFIPEALENHKVKKHFHRINQRPGKPLWFGSNENVTVFGFPGNPVSTIACYSVYCKTWLDHSSGLKPVVSKAALTQDIQFEKELTFFVHVSISNEEGQLKATPLRGNGSGDLVSLSTADGFMELPAEKDHFKKGEIYQVHLF